MIKRFVIFLVLFITFSVLAVQADEWDNFSDVDRMWDGQKAVTNQEFEVWDLLPRNVLKDSEGDVFVIDAEIRLCENKP